MTLLDSPAPVAATSATSDASPRTWTFTDRHTGQRVTITCMAGCQADHSRDIATPTDPDDIWCYSARKDVFLPVNTDGSPEQIRVLSTTTNVMPFASVMAYRLPHVSVELMQDSWIEGLDPDGLETVINTLAERVAAMREAHAQLVATRAEYRARLVH